MSGENSAAIPTPVADLFGDDRWMSMHRRFMLEAQEKEPDVVFIGDSIIAYLTNTAMWDTHFAPMHALNFGIGAERTENVLWRVQNGEMDHMKPKVVVVLVGTNNHGCTALEVAQGIEAIADSIHEKQEETEVLILTLLPRGEKPNDLRQRNMDVNEILKNSLLLKKRTQLVNIDPGFVQPDGTITHHDLWDYLHLTKLGYSKAFEPVHELLLQLLHDDNDDVKSDALGD